MKILWISIMPCGANSIINPNGVLGGWLGALEDALSNKEDIELHECYLCNKPVDEFVHNGVNNYPVYDGFYSSKKYFIASHLGFLFRYMMKDKRVDRMEDIISRVKPDLIHIHGTEGEIGMLTTKIKDIPVVVSIQGILNPIQNKQYSGIPYSEISKRNTLKKFISLTSSHFGRNGWILYKEREKQIFKNTRYLIGRTDWDRRVSSVMAPQAEYFHGGEILRQPFYDSKAWNKTVFSNKFTIVSIITNGLFKGYETVLQAAKLLKNIDFNFEWIIIGQNPRNPNATLFEDFTGIRSHEVHITQVGSKSASEIVDILHQADLYCHVSHIENSPNSVCEAMMTGIPVIATMAGGTASIIKHEETGILFQEGEYFSLAGLIVELSRNFEKAKQMAEAGRITSFERHNPETICRQYIEIYKKILQQ